MTVEAKLKITPVLDQALAVLRTFVQGLEAVGETAKKVDGQGAFDKTRTAVDALGTELDSAKKKIQATGDAAKTADTQGAMDKTRAAVDTLSGQLDGVKQKHDASGKAAKAADEGGTFGKTRQGLESISTQLKEMRTQFLGFLGLQQGTQAVSALAGMSDEYQSMRARLRLVTNGQEEFNTALRTTQGLSAKYNQPLAETSSLYTRLLGAVRPLGGGMREASVASEAMLASLKISGATTAEAGSAILQFSQAVGSGVLRGEEFNAINEAAPRLLDALAQGLGKPKSELKALAEQGALTTSALIQALAKVLPQLQAEAATIPGTIGGAYNQLIGKVQQFMGASAEANGSASNAIAVLKVLADNINVVMGLLQGLIVLLLGGAIGRGAVGLIALGTGATGAATGVGILAAAVRGLWLAISGPVALGALAALAAGWLGLAAAKDAARQRTSAQASDELNAIRAEKATLAAENSPFASRRKVVPSLLANLDRKEKALQAEVDKFTEAGTNTARESFRKSERDSNGSLAGAGMRDPGTIAADRKAYPTKDYINEEYAKKRATSQTAWKTDIDLETDPAKKAKLQQQLNQVLIGQEKERIDKIRTLNKDETLTRIAQAKVLYDKDFELIADATHREKQLLQEKFDQGIVDLQSYLAGKAQLQNQESQQEINRLQVKQKAEQDALAKNRQILKSAKDANSTAGAEEAVKANLSKIAELDTEIVKKERDRLDAARGLAIEGQRYTQELLAQHKAIDTRLKQTTGTESKEDIQRRVQDQFQPELNREFQLGGDGQLTQKLIDLTVLKEVLAQVEREFQRTLQNIKTQEDKIRLDQDAGMLTGLEAERLILEVRKAQLPVLQAQVAEIDKIADRLGPDDKIKAGNAKNTLTQVADLRTEAEKSIRGSISSGIGQFFTDVATGAKNTGEALRNMLGSFASHMMSLISQRLGEQLVESLFPKSGSSGASGGGLGSLIGAGIRSIFGFHSGGVVSEGGATFTRNINAAAFALAPRYHTGGIAGMAPRSDELYAVLQKGEEVLTKDDPRHVANYGKGSSAGGTAGGNVISVTVNGASGDAKTQGAAGADLGRMVESAIDQWAIKNSRSGGVLFRGR